MSKTIFERIRDREIPASIVFEDEDIIAFRDIDPQAPIHILLTPKRVIPRINEALSSDKELLGTLLLKAAEIARNQGLAENGYRLVINNGPDGGETVPHLHFHILGGRTMKWPPG